MIRATDEDGIHQVEEAPPPEVPAMRARGIASTVLGAVLCLGIVAGGAWWLVGLGDRSAESLPVFRAELHPAKIRPEDPGGLETPYQDIQSYEVAAGDGAGRTGETRLAPPPATPTEEDVAMAELSPAASTPGAAPDLVEAGEEVAVPAPATPPARPEDLIERGATASQQAVDAAAQLAARAALSPVQIQLGAFTDRSYTESQWHRIADSNADLLSDRALAIQSTTSGGKTFYRLRVGPFADRAEAARICEALKARGQDCLVATNG